MDSTTSRFEIMPIPVLKDNYVWVIKNQKREVVIIDPGEAAPVLKFLQEWDLNLLAILITHHHWDHVGGIEEIIEQYKVPVYGSMIEDIPQKTHPVTDLEKFNVESFAFAVLEIPGHTLGHVAYYFKSAKALFTGDTLFCAGCGRVFEGTMQQMYSSLMKIAALPNDTRIYCGHEYTLNNLRFAELVEPDNKEIQQRMHKVKMLRDKNIPTVPSLLSDEKKTNPFLCCHLQAIISSVEKYSNRSLTNSVEVFEQLRKWKDQF